VTAANAESFIIINSSFLPKIGMFRAEHRANALEPQMNTPNQGDLRVLAQAI
jgi:hypothetical protein